MTDGIDTGKMRHITHETDLCIIGGGLSGLCAAVAAARHGTRVLLMQDRPMLGGNTSSETRMWVRGAKGLRNRETGIISELEEENIYRNPSLNWSLWDGVMWGKVRDEKNIELLLNCSCCDAETVSENGTYRIVSVTGWQLTTYTWHTVRAKYFADCSGDSVLATLSGAEWRVGREARNEYDEAIGHEIADRKTMGMSCLIQAVETDGPVGFIKPDWAYEYGTEESFNRIIEGTSLAREDLSIAQQNITSVKSCFRPHKLGTSETNFWWIELGGENDSIYDTEEMRDELLKIAYGIWDHIKNHGDHDAQNWDISWIGFLPGKRESRRYIGEYVMTENDIEAGGKFDDIIAFGGWPMDDHNPAGFRSYLSDEPASVIYPSPSPYGIPYRVLYGREVSNMFFAGRNISVTHAALSSTRVMATCALIGQAMGTAASICIRENETPHGVYLHRIRELQKELEDDGCWLPGRKREIPPLTKEAAVSLSPEKARILFNGEEWPGENGECNSIALRPGDEISFAFTEEKDIHSLRLRFDPDFTRESISVNKKMRVFTNTSCRGKDFVPVKVARTLVRGFEVEADGKTVYSTGRSHNSLVKIPLNLRAKKITVRFTETWGSEDVIIYSCDIE